MHGFAMPLGIGVICIAWIGFLGFQLIMRYSPWRKRKRAIIEAIGCDDFTSVKQIVASGFSLNFDYWDHVWWSWNGSPLSAAFLKRDSSIADFLIANGASPSPRSPGNQNLLVNAVRANNFKLIDVALAAGHDIHFKPDKRNKPLATAIHHQQLPLARFLISRGASKEDLTLGDCRWWAMNSETILFVRELGVDVPSDVLAAVQNGEWGKPSSRASKK